jgi:hypothetical protein
MGGISLNDFKKAFDPKSNGAAAAFNPQTNGVDAAFNPSKNGFNASTNQTMVNAANGGSGGAVVGSTNGGTPDLLGDGKKAFSPEQSKKNLENAFSDKVWNPEKNGIADAINAAGDAVGNYMSDTAGDIKDAAVGANEDLQTMLLIGGAILLVVLLMD